jgi:hypothetical protein
VDDRGAGDREVYLDFEVLPDARIGVYANTVTVWHSPYEFALDWGLMEAPQAVNVDDPTSPLRIPGAVIARVRIPVGLVFDVMRALNQSMTRYEAIFGEIRGPLEEDDSDNFGDET